MVTRCYELTNIPITQLRADDGTEKSRRKHYINILEPSTSPALLAQFRSLALVLGLAMDSTKRSVHWDQIRAFLPLLLEHRLRAIH